MMPFLQGYGRFDRCQWISLASIIYLFKWGDALPGEIEDSRLLHVIRLVAPSGTIAQYPWGLSSEN